MKPGASRNGGTRSGRVSSRRPRTLDETSWCVLHIPTAVFSAAAPPRGEHRRGIVAPPVLFELNGVAEPRAIKADAHALEIGAAVTVPPCASRNGAALPRGGAGGGRSPDARTATWARSVQSLPRHAPHFLQSERMVARRALSLPETTGESRAEKPRRVFRHFQRRPRAETRLMPRCHIAGPAGTTARRSLYRLMRAKTQR